MYILAKGRNKAASWDSDGRDGGFGHLTLWGQPSEFCRVFSCIPCLRNWFGTADKAVDGCYARETDTGG